MTDAQLNDAIEKIELALNTADKPSNELTLRLQLLKEERVRRETVYASREFKWF